MSEEYPCFTITQMAKIPEEILPDFLAELPDLIRHTKQIEAAADDLALELRAAAPWPWKLLPLRFFANVVRNGLTRATFKNDRRGTITVMAMVSENHQPFFSHTKSLRDA